MSVDVDDLRAAAREALLRQHHELFRAAQRVVGVAPLPFEQLSERSLRLKHQQMDPLADAAIAPVLAALAAAEERATSWAAEAGRREADAAAARADADEARAERDELTDVGKLRREIHRLADARVADRLAASRSSSPDTTEAGEST